MERPLSARSANRAADNPSCSLTTLEMLRSPGYVDRMRSPSGTVRSTVGTDSGGVVKIVTMSWSGVPTVST